MKKALILILYVALISIVWSQTEISTFPHSEDFDGTTFPPTGWLNIRTSGTGEPGTWDRQTSGTNPTCLPYSGTGMARYNSHDLVMFTRGALITPQVLQPAEGVFQVRFRMYHDDAAPDIFDQLRIYLNDSPTVPTGYSAMTIYRDYYVMGYDTPNQWYEYLIPLPSSENRNPVYVIFEAESHYGNNIYIDNIVFEEIPPVPLFTVNGNWTFVDVNIDTSDTRQYSITNHGIASGDVESINLAGDFFTMLSNPAPCTLEPDESVFFTIRYSPTALGSHIGTITITYDLPENNIQVLYLYGNCVNPTIIIDTFPWTEDFESGIFPPAGWTYYDLDGAGTSWVSSNDFNHTLGGNTSALHAASVEAPAQDGGQSGWLVSPPIVISSWTLLLDYWSYNLNPQNYQQNAIYISTGSLDPALGDFIQVQSAETVADEWVQNQFAQLYNYEYQTIYIAFKYGGYDADDWYLDDITIAEPITSTIEITHLPLLNNLRTDISHRVTAEIVCSGYPFDFANLHYSVNGSLFNELTMQNYSGDIYYADIPPQALNSTIEYFIQAWNTEGISSGTDAYSFSVENPTWLTYTGTMDLEYFGNTNLSYSVYNLFENPFYGTETPLQVNMLNGLMLNTTSAILEIYNYDGFGQIDLVYSQQVSFTAEELMNFDVTLHHVLIDRQYVMIGFSDIAAHNYYGADRSRDYGKSMFILEGSAPVMLDGMSWVLGAYVTNGTASLAIPQVQITTYLGGTAEIYWDVIDGAYSYEVYGSANPYDEDSWTLLGVTDECLYPYYGSEDAYFFQVLASSELINNYNVRPAVFVIDNARKHQLLNQLQALRIK